MYLKQVFKASFGNNSLLSVVNLMIDLVALYCCFSSIRKKALHFLEVKHPLVQ